MQSVHVRTAEFHSHCSVTCGLLHTIGKDHKKVPWNYFLGTWCTLPSVFTEFAMYILPCLSVSDSWIFKTIYILLAARAIQCYRRNSVVLCHSLGVCLYWFLYFLYIVLFNGAVCVRERERNFCTYFLYISTLVIRTGKITESW